ncbi:MAG: 50S ribosomal protein L29 [Leptonema sp. (in: Bacteria)]|nr:50S ribosomal protein L29 [Leptonema sp. (in: bacteria)]
MATKAKLKDLGDQELKNQLDSLRKELRETRFEFGVARMIENPAKVNKAKKDVARILTILRERELKGNNSK